MSPTPGPWKHRTLKASHEVFWPATGAKVASVPIRKYVDDTQALPNARLIAAAPDLLVALRAMAEHFGPLYDNPMLNDGARHAFDLSRDALSKAEGRKP